MEAGWGGGGGDPVNPGAYKRPFRNPFVQVPRHVLEKDNFGRGGVGRQEIDWPCTGTCYTHNAHI